MNNNYSSQLPILLLVIGTGLLSLKKTRPVLPISCRLKCHNVMGHILDVSCMVVSGGFREILWSSNASRESLQELSSDHEEADTRITSH